eukprot:TRINITY_DN2950_c0_g2_i5.p3 TRINITY_DN2950_c0_g2~~TRINITY_DN2950_c0_g2_i5.p3  ORF type:complete len:109 (+),score=20.90 TRINITY_DN2950_c0_g2_i5:120-446(+)
MAMELSVAEQMEKLRPGDVFKFGRFTVTCVVEDSENAQESTPIVWIAPKDAARSRSVSTDSVCSYLSATSDADRTRSTDSGSSTPRLNIGCVEGDSFCGKDKYRRRNA